MEDPVEDVRMDLSRHRRRMALEDLVVDVVVVVVESSSDL